MLRILDKNKQPICGLDRYRQLRITKRLQFDDKTLEFNALIGDITSLENEGYIETETDRFVVKEIRPSSDGTADVLAQLDVETLEGKTFVRFETVEKTLSEAMALAFAGTGWTVGECNITKLRTLRKENCTSLDMLKQALSVYRCECKINSKQMTVSFYEEIGEDRGVYFMSDLNLRSLTVTKSSYDFYTEIEPYGANGMTIEDVNNGSKILTNYAYSSKSKRIIWKDERYTVAESLKEDAQAKLNDYSKPYVSYMADVVDLASMSDYYSILQYDIGDTITLADNATGTREKQRIVEMVVYPEEPELNSCVFANTTLTFEELAAKFSETADTVDNITIDNGTIDGSKINSFDAQKLSNFDTVLAASGVFGTLVANHAAFEEATVNRFQTDEANITTLQTNYADVAIARIGALETDYASITALLAGTAAASEAQMIHLNVQNAMIDEAFLKSLIAASITANDLKAGTIYTNKHTVQSEDGALMMTGSLLTFKDANNVIRIQIGKDGQGNYNYYLANENGDIIWNAAGITADGVPDGLIVDDMVADSSATYSGINASKLNINSMVGALNEEGGLRSSSIVMDEGNQSLTVAFNTMKQSIEMLKEGGRNLMLNTLVPDVSNASKYPRMLGQTTNTSISGDVTVAEHGVRSTKNGNNYPYIMFGSVPNDRNTLNGLDAGETYILSCDMSWKLFSATTSSAVKRINFLLYYKKNGSTSITPNTVTYAKNYVTAGVEETVKFAVVFKVPEDAVSVALRIIGSITGSSNYEDGDYIELRNLKLEKGNESTAWAPAPEDYLTEITGLNNLIDDLQDQIDGVVDTYYYDYAPTLSNVPASDWATTDYPNHKGDMFLDTSTGKSYRFLQDEQTQAWSWVEIPDTASAQALIAAQNAADLADHKRRVFVATPTPPYDEGDLWFEGPGGDIKTCTTAKTVNQQYDSADWSKLHKYTDDTYASNKYAELTSTIDGVVSRVGTLETTTTSQGQTIASHTSTLEQTATKLSAIITDSQISELDSGTNMYDKLLSVKATADGAVSDVTSLKTWKDNATGQITSLESQQNTMSQTLSGTTSRVSNIERDYLTTSAAQTLINQSAESVTIAVNKTIDGIKVGGRNLIINTLNPDVSKAANYPRLVGQESNTAVPGGTKTVAEHGMKIEVSSATRPYIRFGSNSASSGSMNGLEAGQTYTLSFDVNWKVLSGTITSTANYYMRTYLYTDAAEEGTFANTEYFTFGTITPDDRGDEMSGRCEYTFTVPDTAKMFYLLIRPSLSTSSAYAAGDYIELKNLKLEKGNKTTDWTAAPEDYAGKGDALNNVVVEYATGDSPSTAPSTGWGTGSPTWTQGKYIWQRTAVTKNGQTTYSNVSCIQGAKGEAGEVVSILSTEVKYQAHTSGTSVPTGTWQDTVPTVAQGAYLWSRTKVSYSDGTSTTSYSVGRMGSNGTNGQDGTSPTVTGTVAKYQQSTNGTTVPAGTWQTTPPTATAGQYMWTQTTVTYSDGATAVSYSVSKNGTDGTNGEDGRGISKVTPQYCWHTSDTTAPTTGWKTTNDGYTASKPYLWTRSKIEYDDGSDPEYTTPVCDVTITDIETRLTQAELKITDDAIISTVSTRYGIGDANLIYNSTGYGGSTDGWALSSTSTSYGLSSTKNSTRPGKTDYALSIKVATTSGTTVYMRQTSEHWINVEQGKKYTLSGFYYRGSNVNLSTYVGIEYSTDGGNTWTFGNGTQMTSSATWTAFSKTFTAPANLIRVSVKLSGSSSASSNYMVYVSDLVLVRGETAMPWAESPTSLIEQTSDMIRLKAEKLVWTANNSSLTEAGYLTVTGGEIGGFSIDSTAIFTNSKDSTSNGSILISKSDVARTVAGKSRQSVRLAVGQNFGVLTDGTLIARNVDLSGTIAATAGSIGGIKIGTNGIYTEIDAGTGAQYVYKRYFFIKKNGEIIQYKDRDPESFDPTMEEEWWTDNPYRTGYLYISKDGNIKSTNYTNGYWRTDGRVLRGANEEDGPDGDIWHEDLTGSELSEGTPYIVRLYAPNYTSEGTNFAMTVENVYYYSELNPEGENVNTFILRYNGSVQCTALTISSLSSGTGSTVVANSSGKLFKSSSSKRYKDYIADMTEDEAEKLYDLPVVQFKYKDGYLDREDEMYDKPMHGFFAEDVADLFEDGGIHNNFGDVENYSERAIIARLVKLVQMQHEQIESLKASMQ